MYINSALKTRFQLSLKTVHVASFKGKIVKSEA